MTYDCHYVSSNNRNSANTKNGQHLSCQYKQSLMKDVQDNHVETFKLKRYENEPKLCYRHNSCQIAFDLKEKLFRHYRH